MLKILEIVGKLKGRCCCYKLFLGGKSYPEKYPRVVVLLLQFVFLYSLFPPFLSPLAGSVAPYPPLASVRTPVVLAPRAFQYGSGGLF